MTLEEIIKKMQEEKQNNASILQKGIQTQSNNSRNSIINKQYVQEKNRNDFLDNYSNSIKKQLAPVSKQKNNNSRNFLDKTSDTLNSFGWGLIEGIAKPATKAVMKNLDQNQARYKTLNEQNSNMSSFDKYIAVKQDKMLDDTNNILSWVNNTTQSLSQNEILKALLLGSNRKVNNENTAKKAILGTIFPENLKLKDKIDERENRKYTSKEIQDIIDKEADAVAPNETARAAGNLGYEGVKMGVSALQPGLAPLIYGTTGAIEAYGETDNPNEIIAKGAKDAAYGALMKGTANLARKGITKVIPGVGEKILPTIATNFGSNAIGGASASAITDVGSDIIAGKEIDSKEIGENALKSGLMSGIIGGTTDTIRDVKLSKIKFNKDVNNTIENLQNINKQITEGDASISKNPKIINRLLQKGQKEIDSLASNKYLMQNKKLKEAVSTLQKAYDAGHINNIKIADKNLTGLLGTAEMNLKAQNNIENINKTNEVSKNINNLSTNSNEIPSNNVINNDISQRLAELKKIDTSEMKLLERKAIQNEIKALENGYTNVEEYKKAQTQEHELAVQKYKQKQQEKELKKQQEKLRAEEQLRKEIEEATPEKREQYNIIQKNNPMLDEYHVGIRSPKDIKTADEVFSIQNFEEEGNYPDFTVEMAQKALQDGKVTIYSSNKIGQGTFVSTSKIQALEYAGGNEANIHSKRVSLDEVAWINNSEGQYAKISSKVAPLEETKVKTAIPISEELQLKNDVKNFSKKIDNIDKIKENDSIRVLSKTPKVYQDLGLNDLPMTITKNHTLWAIEKQDKNTHRHGIEKEILKQIPDALSKPLNIVKSGSRNDSIVAITELSNSKGDLIVVPIKVDGKSNVNQIEIDANVLTSIYGKDNDYDSWMKRNQEMGRILYDKDDGIIKKYRDNPPRLQLPNDTISTINNIIPRGENYVNNTENNGKSADIISTQQDPIVPQISPDRSNKSLTIENIVDSRTKKKVKVNEIKELLSQKLVNKGHTVDKLAKATNNPNLTYAYDRTLSTFAEGNYSIGVAQTNNKGEEIGKSIKEIFKPAEDNKLSREFDDYLLNRHNIDRMAIEKTVFNEKITSKESREIIKQYEEQYPQFKEWAEDVYKFNKNELQNLVDAGFINENTKEYLTGLYGSYVPTMRDITETAKALEEKTTGAKNPIKSAKGGTKKILNIRDAMAEQVIRNKKSIRMNELGLELAKSLGEKSILDPNIEITYSADAIMSLGGNVVTYEDEKPIFKVFKNGQAKDLVIGDDLYDSLKKDTIISKIEESKLAPIFNVASEINNKYRDLLTTYSIGFAFNNPIKDLQDATFNTKYDAITFAKNYTKALYQIATKGEYHKQYMANGGGMNSYFEYDKGVLKDTKNPIKKFVKKIQTVNEVLEEAPRLAEFISTLENGGTMSEAMYNSADITTNFKRGGEVTKALNKYGATFLNASVQGLDKTYRTLKGEKGWKGYARLLSKVGIFAIAPSIVNHLLLKNDKDYQSLPAYIKDEYYLFKKGDGKFIRIPKGRLISVMGSASRRVLEMVEGNEFDLKGLKDTAIKQLAPNNPLEDNIFAPIKAVATNKAWYGGDIVSSRLQKQLPKNQYDEKTDEISKWLGNIFNYSPKKINYLLDQYSGGIGDVILPILTPKAENNILEDKFTTDSALKNKYVSEFYDKKDELEKINNDSDKTYQDEVKYKYLTKISSKMGELYAKKREIEMSNISDKEKKETVRDIQKEINWYAENALKNTTGNMTEEQEWNMYIEGIFSNNIRENDNSSDSLDAQYAIENKLCTSREYIDLYNKIKENKQSMPTIKYLEKMKESGLDIKNYVEYKINTKDLKSDKDENGKSIKSSLNEKETRVIMNMNISDKQKDLLFDITNESDDKPTMTDLKKLNGNYLTYLQQSGKKNDKSVSQRDKYMMYVDAGIPVTTLNKYYDKIGKIEGIKNENGKTISGTKKTAVFNYINSLPLSSTQKKILFTKSNSNYGKNYKNEIFTYINSLKLSKKRKEEIWKELYD